ncbi:PAS domain S-box protein [Natronococcus roseus]|uniref:PAS domain S-box protein n=1 Tax=Natronococcus roseus TaxID=1052014 RepID=UPI00374C9466
MSSSRDDAAFTDRSSPQAIVAELSELALRIEGAEELLDAVVDATTGALEADACLVFERLPRGDRAVCRRSTGTSDGAASATVAIDPEDSPVGRAIARGEPVAVDELRAGREPEWPDRLLERDVRSGLWAPVGTDDPWGVLEVRAAAPNAFDADDAATLRTIANVLAGALESASDDADVELGGEWTRKGEFLERSPVGVTVVDADGTLQFANERAEEILERSRTEIADVAHDDPRWGLVDANGEPISTDDFPFDWVLETGEPVTDVELGATRPDGTRVWLSVDAAPLRTDGMDRPGVVFALTDVTDRKRIETEFEEILDRVTDAFYALDAEWRFTHVNERAAELIDVTGRGLVGERVWDVFEWAADSKLRTEYERAMERQEASSFELYYPEPLETWFEIHVYPSETGLSVYFRDISEQKARERRLREERDLTDRIIETNPTGIVTLGPDGSFERMNRRAEGITGYAADELEDLAGGTAGLDPVKPDGEPFSPDEIPTRRVFSDGETIHDLEIGLERADGRRIWLSVSGTPLREDGEISGAVFSFVDITERKRIETDLRESEAKFRQVTENVAEVVWLSSPEKAEMFYVNPAYEEVWGRDRDSLYEDPSSFVDAIHPEDRDRVREALSEQREGTYDEEYRVVRPDGEVRWVRDRAVPIRDENGTVDRIVGIASDVTDQRRVEQELRDRERELSRLMSNVPGMVYRCRNERGWPMEFVSEGCEELTGYSSTTLERGDVQWGTDVVSSTDRGELWERIQANVSDRKPFSMTYRIETASGAKRWVKETGRAVVEDGVVETLEGVIIDVTERKRYQQRLEETNAQLARTNERLERSNHRLEKSNERLEQFAYAASHDLQEPLRMVSSYLRLIEDRYATAFDEDGREFLAFAVDGADRMREMIDGLLAYSRVENQGQPLEPVDLEDVLEDVRDDLRLRLEESDAVLSVGSLPRVEGDASQLRQLFQNLLENAIEYSGETPPKIEVEAERNGETWIVSVSDEGIGIPDGESDRVFEVFERLHPVDDHAGPGIGLALCQRIVERHGGEIRVDSEPGEGSTFSVRLPAPKN